MRQQDGLLPASCGLACASLRRHLDAWTAYLDAGRANNPSMPAYRMLMRLFATHVPLRENQFEVHPKACNLLRMELYRRAKVGGETAGGTSRRILASLECGRREGGRPDDEPRHPESDDGLPWTNVLCLPDIGTA